MSRGGWNKRDQNWRHSKKKNPIPFGLKGREIGLHFRNLQKAKKNQRKFISLTIPDQVISSVKSNIQKIICIAKEKDIELPHIVTNNLTTPEVKYSEFDGKNEPNASSTTKYYSNIMSPRQIKTEPVEEGDSSCNQPNTSLPDFSQNKVENKNHSKMNALRNNQFYKYGYKDIITGTFDEKLEECISRGICIKFEDQHKKDLNITLHEEYKEMLERNGYKKFKKFREILPTYKKSEDILNLINDNQVIVISGETGCGKSTQIPQLILDEALKNKRGANVKILVTQPRRIAASSLAARVAQERGENMGRSVGYSVRLEKVEERSYGSIQFCTTGVLLVELGVNQGLTNWSHIILDEVHERDCQVDMAMCMLKKVMKRRKDLKLILMSATLDAESLSQYYDNCPVMHIEGLAYPVKDVYLEDILQMTKFRFLDCPGARQKKRPKWQKIVYGDDEAKAIEKDIQYKAEIAPWLEARKRTLDPDVYKTLQDSRIEDMNLQLMVDLLKCICRGDPGAVLIFLPGIGDISAFLKLMNESDFFPRSRYEIYPLHSKLPSLDQHKIFERPPDGIRKIIVATNIAETSITIDDIVYVIDCGKIKMSGFNVDRKIMTLNTEWVSQANLRQRRGRAGRCQPGICYHLMTSYRASILEERLLPELQRSNLLEATLEVKRLRLGLARHAFSIMPSPPDPSTVEWAVKHLQQCGALDVYETLTPLGWHLARLPIHPAAGKLLLLAALFGCLDRAASVAAVWSFKDPFLLVLGKEREVDEARRNLTLGEPSDHIAISEAIMRWEQCRSWRQKQSFAYDNFLSHNTLELLMDMKRQLGQNLMQMGFLPSGDVRSQWENRNAHNLSLFKAVVAAALYPNIASVRWVNLNSRNPNRSPRVAVYTPEDGKICLHPSSVMATPQHRGRGPPNKVVLCDNPGANWLVYWLKQRSTKLFLFDVTLIYTLPLLFFGEFIFSDEEDEKGDECYLSVKTLTVKCKKETTDLLCKLRSLLDLVLASKVISSGNSTHHSEFEEEVINAVIKLITAEDERAEYLDDDLSESDTSEGGESYRKY